VTRQSRENPLSVTRKQVVRHIMCSFIHNGQQLGPKQGENVLCTLLFHFVLCFNHCNNSIWLGNLVFMSLGGFRTNFQGLYCKYTWYCVVPCVVFINYSREIKRYACYYCTIFTKMEKEKNRSLNALTLER